jgi:hypothetical protein
MEIERRFASRLNELASAAQYLDGRQCVHRRCSKKHEPEWDKLSGSGLDGLAGAQAEGTASVRTRLEGSSEKIWPSRI